MGANRFRDSSTVEQRPVVHFLPPPRYIMYRMADKRKYADRREELIRAVAKRRRKIKSMAIEYKGGKCQICGYSKYQGAFDLHHIDPKQKDFGIGDKGYTRSWERVKAELDKCILVCANCHREVEAGVTQLPKEI